MMPEGARILCKRVEYLATSSTTIVVHLSRYMTKYEMNSQAMERIYRETQAPTKKASHAAPEAYKLVNSNSDRGRWYRAQEMRGQATIHRHYSAARLPPRLTPGRKAASFWNRVLGTNHSASYNVLLGIVRVFLPGLYRAPLHRPSLPDLLGSSCKLHVHETHAGNGRTADRLISREFSSLNLFYCVFLLYISATREITVILALLSCTKQTHCDALLVLG